VELICVFPPIVCLLLAVEHAIHTVITQLTHRALLSHPFPIVFC